MNYYKYRGKRTKHKSVKKPLLVNIIIIAAVFIAVFAFAVILGNNLKKKLDTSDVSTDTVFHYTEPETTGVEEEPVAKNNKSYDELSAVGGYLELSECPDTEKAEQFVANLKESGYTGLIFRATDTDGNITYASSAAYAATKLMPSTSLVSMDNLSAAVGNAKQQGIKTTAIISFDKILVSEGEGVCDTYIKKKIIAELSEIGFEKIILCDFVTAENLNSDFTKNVYEVISEIREASPSLDIGIMVTTDILENPEITPSLELMFRYTDFFCLDLSNAETYTVEALSALTEKISGSLLAYNTLVLLDGGSTEEIQNYYAFFSAGEKMNISFITPNTDYAAETKTDEKTDKKKKDGEDTTEVSPYDKKIIKYSLETTAETSAEESQTEETSAN